MSSAASGLQDVAQKIRALDAEFIRHAKAKDAAGITEFFYAEDALLLPPNAPLVRGKKAIREFWTSFMTQTGTDVTIDSHDISASGDLAYSVGRWTGTIGGVKQQGKYCVVLRRQADGGYKAIVDAFNADA